MLSALQTGLEQVQGQMLALLPSPATDAVLCAEDSVSSALTTAAAQAAAVPAPAVLGFGRATSTAGYATAQAEAGTIERQDPHAARQVRDCNVCGPRSMHCRDTDHATRRSTDQLGLHDRVSRIA